MPLIFFSVVIVAIIYVIYYEISFAEFIDFRLNGAIMFKQMIIAIVLMSLLVGDSWNIEAGSRRPPRSHADFQASESKVREKRFYNPFPKLFSIWNALTHIYSLYVEVS